MSPRYLRYEFPGSVRTDARSTPEEHARALAAVLAEIPVHELTVGRLETAARWAHDPGALNYTHGAPMGEEVTCWLRIVVAPGGRQAWLDVDVEEMGRVQARAERARRR